MRGFIKKALDKFDKLDREKIHSLLMQLALENEQYESVLDSMTDAVVVVDADNTVMFCNKAALRIVPFKTPDPLEKILWNVVDDEEIAAFFKKSLENQEQVTEEEFTLDSRGRSMIISCSILPLLWDGTIRGSLLHIEDVTRKRMEDARLRRAESLASLTTLAAGVAHEIKNPLGSIGIHIQLIQRAVEKDGCLGKETADKYLGIINEEIERLNGIIVDFLFAVRPMDIDLKETDLNRLLLDIMDFIKYEAEEARVDMLDNLGKSLPKVLLDEKFIKQAVLNIIKNALAAMPDGGTLTFTTEDEGDMVAFTLRDTGIGISEENMAKIFEPYFTTREFGSGLGLTLVYKIIREHGGEISLKSREGEGTCFTIRLPVSRKDQRQIDWKRKEA
ncbi:MAG: PAS domain S-box protein [Spirochaetales bacterium]|nr:PAS domain S-box protein [Spirochaetales bacterium]